MSSRPLIRSAVMSTALMAAAFCGSANAEVLRYTFTGEVSVVGGIFLSDNVTYAALPFSLGDAVSGVIDYTNSGIADTNNSTQLGRYLAAANWVSFQAGAFAFEAGATNPYNSSIQNGNSLDGAVLSGSLAGSAGSNALGALNGFNATLQLFGDPSIFSSDALPAALPTGLSTWNYAPMTIGFMQARDGQGNYAGQLNFTITSFEQVTAVPEPSTYALALMGLCAVGFVARRRRPQPR